MSEHVTVWAVHGVRVSRQVVEAPETLTVEQILGEENTEVRRVMIERFGAERLIAEAEAELLDEVHEPPFPGLIDAKLYRLRVVDDEPIVMVKCRNSTPEMETIRVAEGEPVPADARPVMRDTWEGDVTLGPLPGMYERPQRDRAGNPIYKPYWLRVHPECCPLMRDGSFGHPQELTALNALASTWGERGETYAPVLET